MNASCDPSSSAGQTAVADADAGFGPGFPLVGVVGARGDVSSTEAVADPAQASALATVSYALSVEMVLGVPGLPPLDLPILFAARGEGSSNQVGRFASASVSGSASISGPDIGLRGFSFDGVSGAFDDVLSIRLTPGQVYSVDLAASCGVSAFAETLPGNPDPIVVPAFAFCQSHVDPQISFDQASFDAERGDETFPLDQSYRIVFSPNVAPPVPISGIASGALLASLLGLAGAILRSRRDGGPRNRSHGM